MARRRAPREPRTDPPDAQAAFEIAARFLGTRPRTRWELQRRLRRAGVEDAVIETTTQRLADLGYLDDAAFARWWGEQRDRHAPRGRRMVEAELRQRGVTREVIEAYRDEHAAPERAPEDESLPSSEQERAREALERHLRGRPLPEDRKALERIGMYLMRRGFDAETARATIRAAGAATDAEST
ncbi:MAG TPA: regulatory protein RecX [Candidatus Limnocylindria bacterium]|nr:regulatory protein RecX [Candidatus Limnocylindria bacterium]